MIGGLYAGMHKFSCNMCGEMGQRPVKTVVHVDGSSVDICAICYGKCLASPKFQAGLESGDVVVIDY